MYSKYRILYHQELQETFQNERTIERRSIFIEREGECTTFGKLSASVSVAQNFMSER